MKNAITRVLNNFLDEVFGLRIQPSADKRLSAIRSSILERLQIELVIDAGANEGQWAKRLRGNGYKAQIVSFEPSDSFEILKRVSKDDLAWDCENVGLSESNGSVPMFSASNNNLSSSLLPPKEILTQGFNINFSSGKSVQIISLDSYMAKRISSPFFLKLDVQGAEMMALRGSESSLQSCVAIEFESSLKDLYQGESTHYEIAEWLMSRGFSPLQIAITHWDSELRTISLDSIFIKRNLMELHGIGKRGLTY